MVVDRMESQTHGLKIKDNIILKCLVSVSLLFIHKKPWCSPPLTFIMLTETCHRGQQKQRL